MLEPEAQRTGGKPTSVRRCRWPKLSEADLLPRRASRDQLAAIS
jgi:hypothetical protein